MRRKNRAVPALRRSRTQTVRLFTATRPNCYYTYNGIEQHADSMQINRAVCLFYALTGNLDRRGGNVRFPKPANDVEGRKLLCRADKNASARRDPRPTNTGRCRPMSVQSHLTGSHSVRGF
jgi:hypothetical protein